MTSCFRLMAVLLLAASPAYAQSSPAGVEPRFLEFERISREPLPGLGSHIGVSARDRIASDARDAAGILARFAAQPDGVIIDDVRPHSPASRAGLMKGDIVIRFDGHRVSRASQFSRLVAETPPGWTVRMRIVRNGKTRDIAITPTL